jgi:hypothetical protein
MSSDYPPTVTGLILSGDVAALQREVRVLRQLNARLAALLEHSKLPHTPDCLTMYNAAYPCSCAARAHNARIDAALGETDHAE